MAQSSRMMASISEQMPMKEYLLAECENCAQERWLGTPDEIVSEMDVTSPWLKASRQVAAIM
jgi:hypothetical protein